MVQRLKKYFQLCSRIGPFSTFYSIGQRALNRLSRSKAAYHLRTKNAQYPLLCRPNSSDFLVFEQIFIGLEYSPLIPPDSVNLVIDCGANVGYSSAYFLTRFPECTVIAVEPNSDNFAILKQNLAPYGARARVVHAGIWSHPADLTFSEVPYRGGEAWSFQVRECKPGESPSFSAVDIETLRQESGQDKISILKMDIEGAEVVVFGSESHKQWIDHVEAMAVELHDDTYFGKASSLFSDCCRGKFKLSKSGELTLASRSAS